ncbi:MAG: sensor histidine kinase, partial [Burkholderiaceae bacterium]
ADIRRDDLRAHEVIHRLRALLEKNEVVHAPMALHPTLREAIALIEPEARRRGITLETRFDASRDGLLGDPVQLQQVLLNLMLNAFDAMLATPAPQRHLLICTEDAEDDLRLTVADRGHGLTGTQREHAFRSFWTTKSHGLGLGLPIVRAIVDAHHGQVSLDARAGGGAVATVRLPRTPVSAPQPALGRAHTGVEPGARGVS